MTTSGTSASSTASPHPRPAVTVDLVVMALKEQRMHVLLVERGVHPEQGKWALPGGFVRVGAHADPSLKAAARRELAEETGLDAHLADLRQVRTFDAPPRDPRMRVLTVAYAALLRPEWLPYVKAGSDARNAKWHVLDDVLDHTVDLAFDHHHIVDVTVRFCQRQLTSSDLAFSLVPHPFTITELRHVMEGLAQTTLSPANFQRRVKRMERDGLVENTGETRATRRKPAALYRFVRPSTGAIPPTPSSPTPSSSTPSPSSTSSL